MSTEFRQLPSVNQLALDVGQHLNGQALPHVLLVEAARRELDLARQQLAEGRAVEGLAQRVLERVQQLTQPSLRPVINGSGVIIQTNLGRAPLSAAALAAMQAVGAGYSNLEYDLEAGQRGSRASHLDQLLCAVTGAEAALAVNNAAAALYLVLSAFAQGREVVVSRGQAVEIGGGFRIPDVMRQSGAVLVDVGTTNRTYLRDYAQAIGERTALLLRVHSSNFKVQGFVHEVALAELASLAHERGLTLLDDLGSGALLDTQRYGLAPEPTVQASLAAGADLVVFSGDKLLGGPQAGLIVGRKALIAQLKGHPLLRALRLDKTTIAGLAATLLSYLRGEAERELPVWRMIAASPKALEQRARELATQLGSAGIAATPTTTTSTVGGGSLPGATLPSWGVALEAESADQLARRLRQGQPALVGRINAGRLVFDLRTILPEQDQEALAALMRFH